MASKKELSFKLLPLAAIRPSDMVRPYHGMWTLHSHPLLKGWRLVIYHSEPDLPARRWPTLKGRYELNVTKTAIEFDLNYVGLQKSGMNNFEKYANSEVIIYMRRKFAEVALPHLKTSLHKQSAIRQLEKFSEDVKTSDVNDLVDRALGL